MDSSSDPGLGRRLVGFVRLLAWSGGILLLAALAPVGQALWSEALGVSASVQIAEWTPTPTPPSEEGCTPGFGKQEQHFSSWPEPYLPKSDLAQTFGVDPLAGDPTLLEGLEAKGGGLNALYRHAVAALLNAASDGLDYRYDVPTVLAMFVAALVSGDYETTKDAFEAASEGDCPLPLNEDEAGTLITSSDSTPEPTVEAGPGGLVGPSSSEDPPTDSATPSEPAPTTVASETTTTATPSPTSIEPEPPTP